MRVSSLSRAANAAAAAGARRVGAPAYSSSLASSTRFLSSAVDSRGEAEGKRRRRASNFWQRWGERSQQEFWQDVGFGHDRAMDERRSGKAAAKDAKRKQGISEAPSQRDDLDGEYWDAMDAFDDDATLDTLDGIGSRVDAHYWGTSSLTSRAAMERANAARAALLLDGELAPQRRSELMMLLEDAGPEGLLPTPKMPNEDWLKEKEEGTLQLSQDLSRNLITARNYNDGVHMLMLQRPAPPLVI